MEGDEPTAAHVEHVAKEIARELRMIVGELDETEAGLSAGLFLLNRDDEIARKLAAVSVRAMHERYAPLVEAAHLWRAALVRERDCIRESCCIPSRATESDDFTYPLETMEEDVRPEYDRLVEAIAKVDAALASLTGDSQP